MQHILASLISSPLHMKWSLTQLITERPRGASAPNLRYHMDTATGSELRAGHYKRTFFLTRSFPNIQIKPASVNFLIHPPRCEDSLKWLTTDRPSHAVDMRKWLLQVWKANPGQEMSACRTSAGKGLLPWVERDSILLIKWNFVSIPLTFHIKHKAFTYH